MKIKFIFILSFILVLVNWLSGCSNTEEKIDDLIIGSWQREDSSDILTFRSDGNYTVDPDGEMASWSIIEPGKIKMFNLVYNFELSENNLVLKISNDELPLPDGK